jgi:hypothetical protein
MVMGDVQVEAIKNYRIHLFKALPMGKVGYALGSGDLLITMSTL